MVSELRNWQKLKCWITDEGLNSKIYQSCEALETHIEELTQSLSDACNIIWVQEVIDERENAQLVLQHSHLGKLNQSLQTKESKTVPNSFPKDMADISLLRNFVISCKNSRERRRTRQLTRQRGRQMQRERQIERQERSRRMPPRFSGREC